MALCEGEGDGQGNGRGRGKSDGKAISTAGAKAKTTAKATKMAKTMAKTMAQQSRGQWTLMTLQVTPTQLTALASIHRSTEKLLMPNMLWTQTNIV